MSRKQALTSGGFPHSEIPGSKPVCGSPGLIAACHVLHRLLAPRHPPYALSSLTIRKELTRAGTRDSGLEARKSSWSVVRASRVCVSSPSSLRTAIVVGMLPFAGYSVVKDQPGLCPGPRRTSLVGPQGPTPFRALMNLASGLEDALRPGLSVSPILKSAILKSPNFKEPWWRIPGSNR